MGTKEVKYCDVCNDQNDSFVHLQDVIGTSYDGHKNEEEVIYIDLCKRCYTKLSWLIQKINGTHNRNFSPYYDKHTVEKILYVLIKNKKITL